ncbi:acetyl-coenzyme a transporter 1, partial [Nannochloropsis gaditana CCMP526]|uniref:acetyl-coenzyme a transporter 1 n=1 Tax=Nannochloropsis gaditana (strain CCMP526) TaxID=1093141 RepID=UPI00029F7FE9
TTLLVALKPEERKREEEPTALTPSVSKTYQQLWRILKLPPVRSMCLVLLTVKAGFAVTDAATNLKLIEYGMPKEEIALMSPLLILTGRAPYPPHPTLPALPFLSLSPPSFPPSPPPPLLDPSPSPPPS